MHNKKIFSLLTVFVLTVLLATAMTVCASAAITVKDETVIGLSSSASYEYASITVSTASAPSYTAVKAGSTSISGLTPGLWAIRDTATSKVTVVWIKGDAEDRKNIGDVYYNASCGKDVVRTQTTTNWVDGVWTGTSSVNHSTFATYYLSSHGHISTADASGLSEGTVTLRSIRTKFQNVYYKYAYAPDEIIPVDELYTLGFNVGVRQTAFKVSYSDTATDPNLKTIYKLHTIDETGTVTVHTTKMNVAHSNSNAHSLAVANDFPDAKGWVIGLEIYPYGEVPINGLTITSSKNANNIWINSCFYIQYIPNLYTTKEKSGAIELPFQYNGANTAYIQGYGDGTFNPDGSITKAEVSTILANLILGQNMIPEGKATKFADLSANEWYYNAVNYLETKGIFNYVTGTKINADKPISRGELAQMIYGFAAVASKGTAKFTDVTADSTYGAAILALADNGILNGYADRTFRPDSSITRAEAITVINRIINLEANDSTVSKELLKNTFADIDGHWAEAQILMAANDNVKSDLHLSADASDILVTDNTVQLETNHIKITINKSNGKIISLINKYNGAEILGASTAPWFSYIVLDSGFTFSPKLVDVVDNRLKIVYGNGTEAYFVIDVKDNYFTMEMDSSLPYGVKNIYFGNITVNTEYSTDVDSYRISAVSMHMNTNMVNRPGGSALKTTAYASRKFGTRGAKLGITFSKFGGAKQGEHRAYLKEILDAIDRNVGISSTMGSAYTYDNTDPFGDYVIQSGGLSASTATETAQTLRKYSIDQLDFHQGGSSFIQGDFNFVCAKETGETFTTAAQFKERIGNLVTAEGIQLGLHTYTSLVSSSATTILTNPKWQRQIMHIDSENLTLASDVTADATVFPTVENPTGIKLYGELAGGGTSSLPWSGPNTGYFLIDEEIVLVTASDTTGLTTVSRGKCGTTATAHSAGSTIIHYLGHYGMFQSTPGSELFYHIADLTAQAYNEGGFRMIYLDGFESFARELFAPGDDQWYYYASFLQRLISKCEVDPLIEGSAFPVSFWNARARGGAVDHAVRETRKYNFNHLTSNVGFLKSYLTATLGWFNYAPDITATYKNTYSKTMFRDDLDFMGSIGVAYDMSTVANGFSVSTYKTYTTISNNTMYYSLYSILRKSGYFSDTVKETLQEGIMNGKEYRLQEQADGSWAFREMTYFKNKVFDLNDKTYATGSGTNPYNAQTPYIRIEQRFSTLSKNEATVFAFDETAEVSTQTGKHTFTTTDLSSKRAFKIKVYGNGDATGGILLTLNSASISEVGRLDFFLPTSHTGWREFILIDADNADYDGYEFAGDYITSVHYATFRNGYDFTTANSVTVNVAGNCTGVMIDDLKAYTLTNSPAVNPSVTINGSTITFKATVRSGEYIEYLPELGKAYHHSYNYSTLSPTNNGNTATVKEITFTGSVSVPAGDFTYTYNASKKTGLDVTLGAVGGPLRAKVVIGLQSSELIANESGWTATLPEIPEDIQYITLT